MKQILLSLLTVWMLGGTVIAQAPQTKVKTSKGQQSEKGSQLRSQEAGEHDEHGRHRFYKDTLLAKAGIFYDSLSLKGYRVLTTAQLQGSPNYLAKFSTSQSLVNSLLQENGSRLFLNGAMGIKDSITIGGPMVVRALASLGAGLNVNGVNNFNGPVNANGFLNVSALTSLNAGLNVKGTTRFSDSVNIGGVTNFSGPVNANGLLNVNALTSLNAGLNVKGTASFSDSMTVNGVTNLNKSVTIGGPVTANALTSLTAGLNVSGTTNFKDSVKVNGPININAPMSLGSGLNVSGATNLNGAVITNGPVNMNALTSLNAGLNVKGTANFSDSINVNGAINVNTPLSLGSDLNVKGITNLNKSVTIGGPVTANALTSLTAGLNVSGTTSFKDSVKFNGPININSLMSLGSGLNVNGATNLNGAVTASGPVTVNALTNLGAGLNVNGPVLFNNGLSLPTLPAGQTTDSLLTIDASGTVRKKDAGALFNPHPSFTTLSLTGPLTGTTAQFSNGFSLGNAANGVYQWQITGSNPYLALSTATNANAFIIQPNGHIGVGTSAPGDYQMAVEGTIGTRKLKVTQASPWADYVFEPAYQLKSLSQVETFIRENKHLPEVPSAKDVEKNGIDVGETAALLLKKIEELTLYLIDMKKENEMIQKKSEKQQTEIEELKRQILSSHTR